MVSAKTPGYSVTVLTPPRGQFCTVLNRTGNAAHDIVNVAVFCKDITYRIGVSVIGAFGDITLQNNNGNDLTIAKAQNGSIHYFSNVVTANINAYSISVLKPPHGQMCVIENGTGKATGDVNNISVICKDIYHNR
eukprot:UN00225